MKTTLAIFFLSVQSSYANNSEEPATEDAFDTVQFFASDDGVWRIKTFATDQDVHVFFIGDERPDIVELAKTNTAKHYGDVLTEGYIIETDDGLEGVRRELKDRGLPDNLETSEGAFSFWAPEGTSYRTRTKPTG